MKQDVLHTGRNSPNKAKARFTAGVDKIMRNQTPPIPKIRGFRFTWFSEQMSLSLSLSPPKDCYDVFLLPMAQANEQREKTFYQCTENFKGLSLLTLPPAQFFSSIVFPSITNPDCVLSRFWGRSRLEGSAKRSRPVCGWYPHVRSASVCTVWDSLVRFSQSYRIVRYRHGTRKTSSKRENKMQVSVQINTKTGIHWKSNNKGGLDGTTEFVRICISNVSKESKNPPRLEHLNVMLLQVLRWEPCGVIRPLRLSVYNGLLWGLLQLTARGNVIFVEYRLNLETLKKRRIILKRMEIAT